MNSIISKISQKYGSEMCEIVMILERKIKFFFNPKYICKCIYKCTDRRQVLKFNYSIFQTLLNYEEKSPPQLHCYVLYRIRLIDQYTNN